jgi:UDP-N-acetylmuramate dehydrogenase
MLNLEENVSLKPYNTFGLEVKADYFVEINSPEDIISLMENEYLWNMPRLILGGGSNVLFIKDYKGLVLKNQLKGISQEREDEDSVIIKAYSGELWHDLVLYAIARNLGGIENLSLIPGTAGAAPIQNIGAYGVELKDVFHSLEALNLENGRVEVFDKIACRFGYRDSVFKNEAKGKYFILSISLKLSKKPVFNISYGAITKTLEAKGIHEPSVKAISEVVCSIRRSKLPDPAVIGNAGSFFKNPEIEKGQFEDLLKKYPDLPSYPAPEGRIKVPAGWLIEACGWKGRRIGHTGSHKDQALVLVNYGGASGEEISGLAFEIQKSVKETFGILISPEVNMI